MRNRCVYRMIMPVERKEQTPLPLSEELKQIGSALIMSDLVMANERSSSLNKATAAEKELFLKIELAKKLGVSPQVDVFVEDAYKKALDRCSLDGEIDYSEKANLVETLKYVEIGFAQYLNFSGRAKEAVARLDKKLSFGGEYNGNETALAAMGSLACEFEVSGYDNPDKEKEQLLDFITKKYGGLVEFELAFLENLNIRCAERNDSDLLDYWGERLSLSMQKYFESMGYDNPESLVTLLFDRIKDSSSEYGFGINFDDKQTDEIWKTAFEYGDDDFEEDETDVAKLDDKLSQILEEDEVGVRYYSEVSDYLVVRQEIHLDKVVTKFDWVDEVGKVDRLNEETKADLVYKLEMRYQILAGMLSDEGVVDSNGVLNSASRNVFVEQFEEYVRNVRLLNPKDGDSGEFSAGGSISWREISQTTEQSDEEFSFGKVFNFENVGHFTRLLEVMIKNENKLGVDVWEKCVSENLELVVRSWSSKVERVLGLKNIFFLAARLGFFDVAEKYKNEINNLFIKIESDDSILREVSEQGMHDIRLANDEVQMEFVSRFEPKIPEQEVRTVIEKTENDMKVKHGIVAVESQLARINLNELSDGRVNSDIDWVLKLIFESGYGRAPKNETEQEMKRRLLTNGHSEDLVGFLVDYCKILIENNKQELVRVVLRHSDLTNEIKARVLVRLDW